MKLSGFKLPRTGAEYLRYSSLGLEMGVAVAIGLLIGWWLDRTFGTKPWFTIIFLLFGIGAGFKNILLLLKEELRKDEEHRES